MSAIPGPGAGRPIVVIGAGGHAKVVIECLRYAGWNIIGCTDVDPSPRNCAGVPVLGDDGVLGKLRSDGVAHAFCALGANGLRERIGRRLIGDGFDLPFVRGPGTNLSASARIGAGTILMPGATINVDTCVGALAIINTNASVDHDGMIGDAAHIGPGSALAGEVAVGARSFIATGSSVIPRISIGTDVVVGAGSTVIRDIADRAVAFGNPARVHRFADRSEPGAP